MCHAPDQNISERSVQGCGLFRKNLAVWMRESQVHSSCVAFVIGRANVEEHDVHRIIGSNLKVVITCNSQSLGLGTKMEDNIPFDQAGLSWPNRATLYIPCGKMLIFRNQEWLFWSLFSFSSFTALVSWSVAPCSANFCTASFSNFLSVEQNLHC